MKVYISRPFQTIKLLKSSHLYKKNKIDSHSINQSVNVPIHRLYHVAYKMLTSGHVGFNSTVT